ncbi:MAG: hypothetical protein EHM48_09445 [Planctomycetaceae bacterium]|nr:MAG: hypothetical protein EHM48_09445 [Planctomycetaceae bacterium]
MQDTNKSDLIWAIFFFGFYILTGVGAFCNLIPLNVFVLLWGAVGLLMCVRSLLRFITAKSRDDVDVVSHFFTWKWTSTVWGKELSFSSFKRHGIAGSIVGCLFCGYLLYVGIEMILGIAGK